MQRLSLPVVERADGTPGLKQRCAALSGRCCTVYAQRPEACRHYRCHLLIALSEGEVTLEEALAVVDEAHARSRAVEAVLPPESSGSLSAQAHELRDQAESYLDRHFRGRHRGTLSGVRPPRSE